MIDIINNYESIEMDVSSYNNTLSEEVKLLTVELKKIDERESIESIQSTIDEIKENINTIEMRVIPEFPIVLIVLASITSSHTNKIQDNINKNILFIY